jgi:hypothetical protein
MSNIDSKALQKAKKQHFDFLRKNNAITDAKNGELSLGAMKSLDVILQIYQEKQETQLLLELSYLRKKLGLERNNDYVDRIKSYLLELKLPFELRDFNEIKTGKQISWALTSFLHDVKAYKDTQHIIEINISENFLNYLVEKAGYTNVDIALTKSFKTKYGYKIYEMFSRYYSMPNKIDKRIGTISKDINELNDKFGTSHKHASKISEGIVRGINEIKKLTGDEIFFFYDKTHKKFVFSWEKDPDKLIINSCIPKKRITEFVEWLVHHNIEKINNVDAYKKKIKALIKKNELGDLEKNYRGMLMHKYNLSIEAINNLKTKEGFYKDF